MESLYITIVIVSTLLCIYFFLGGITVLCGFVVIKNLYSRILFSPYVLLGCICCVRGGL